MDPKILTEGGLKALLSKHKVKDNGLQKALAAYDKLDDDAHDDCLETIAQIGKLAASLKKAKDAAANKAIVDYLEDLMDASDKEEKDVAKAKAESKKTDAADQKKKEKEDAEKEKKEKKDGEEDEEEEEEELEGEYGDRLLTAFKKLKTMNGTPMKFVVCDARPFVGLAIGKRVGTKQKEELSKMTGGSKRFLKPALCFWDGDQYVFEPEQMVPGLAKKLVKSVKNFTGKKFRIVVGDESAGGDDDKDEEEGGEGEAEEDRPKHKPQAEETPDASGESEGTGAEEEEAKPKQRERYAPKPLAPPTLSRGSLEKAPEVWHNTRNIIETNIEELKKAVKSEYADSHPDLLKQIEEGIKKLDTILESLDHRLADSLAKAHNAGGEAAKKAELKNSKAIMIEHLKFVKSEPLIAHIDSNPFGVSVNLKKILTDTLTNMAESIGH